VLLINGSQTIGFHRRINECLGDLLPTVEKAQIAGTHGASRTSPEEFVRLVRAFLEKHR
jgi:hypothetical protein